MTAFVNVSSLHPIDSTALICHGLLNPGDELHFAVNDSAEFDEGSPYRKHVARGALPTCSWLRDHDGTWRQTHEPLSRKSTLRLSEALAGLEASICDRVKEYSPPLAKRVQEYCEHLAETGTRSANAQWPDCVASLIHTIAKELIGRDVTVLRWTEVQDLLRDTGAVSDFLRCLVDAGRQSPSGALTFTRGGYIEIHADGGFRRRFRCCRALEPDVLELFDLVDSPKFRLDVSDSPIVRFGGPLEMGLLSRRFTLVDHPWFAVGVKLSSEDHASIVEYVSPPVVHDKDRASRAAGGGGNRLNPLGYTLLDFASPDVAILIQALLGLSSPPSVDQLAHWRRLLLDFPSASQKAAKDQRSVRSYRHMLEQECLREYRCNWRHSSSVGFSQQRRTVLGLGDDLVRCAALLAVHRRQLVSADVDRDGEQRARSELASLVAAGRELSTLTTAWLARWGDSVETLTSLGRSLERQLVACMDQWSDRAASAQKMGASIRLLRALADRYFGFALFFSSAVLKATPILLYVLLGPEGASSELTRLLKVRTQPRLYFNPTLWRHWEPASAESVRRSRATAT